MWEAFTPAGSLWTGTQKHLDSILRENDKIMRVETVDYIGYSCVHGCYVFNELAMQNGKLAALAPLAHRRTWLAVTAERAVSRCLGGNCSVPLPAYARFDGEHLVLDAAWGDPEGRLPLLHAQASAAVDDFTAADSLGQDIANRLLTPRVCYRLHTSADTSSRST